MTQTRTIRLFMAGLAAGALALSGCSKDKTDDGAADENGEAAKGAAADQTGAARPGAEQAMGISGDAKKALAYLPANSTFVMGLNPSDVMKNEKLKAFLPLAMRQAPPELTEMKVKCGIDPFTAFSSIVAGGDPDAEGNEVVVVGLGIERATFESCAQKLAADGAEVKSEGKFTIIDKPDTDEDFVSMWPDDTTMVGGPLTKEQLGGLELGLQNNTAMTDLLRNVDTSGGIWLVAGKMDKMGEDIEGAFGTLSFATGFKADVGIRMASAELAKQKVAEAKGEIEGMSQQAGKAGEIIRNKLEVKADAKDIIVQLNLTMEELTSIMPMVQQMGMMMMGGGMGGMPQ